LVGALGLLAGAGLGAVLGGLCVRALGNLLGREGVGLLSGLALRQVTGAFEGLMIGTATCCAGWAVFAGWSRLPVLTLGLFSGALAGALIHLSGGTLLAGSLYALDQGLPGAQLSLARLASLFAASGFTPLVQGVTAVVEGAIFAGAPALRQPCRPLHARAATSAASSLPISEPT
jgi:hypothetical protein